MIVGELVVYAVVVSYYALAYVLNSSWLLCSIVVVLCYGVVEVDIVGIMCNTQHTSTQLLRYSSLGI